MEVIEKEITDLVAEIIEMDTEKLWENRDKHFVEELDVDSMVALEILASLEKKYRIDIPEEDILELTSVRSTIDFVQRKLQEKAPSP